MILHDVYIIEESRGIMFKKSRCTLICRNCSHDCQITMDDPIFAPYYCIPQKQHSAFNGHREDMTLFCLTDSKMEGRWLYCNEHPGRRGRSGRRQLLQRWLGAINVVGTKSCQIGEIAFWLSRVLKLFQDSQCNRNLAFMEHSCKTKKLIKSLHIYSLQAEMPILSLPGVVGRMKFTAQWWLLWNTETDIRKQILFLMCHQPLGQNGWWSDDKVMIKNINLRGYFFNLTVHLDAEKFTPQKRRFVRLEDAGDGNLAVVGGLKDDMWKVKRWKPCSNPGEERAYSKPQETLGNAPDHEITKLAKE